MTCRHAPGDSNCSSSPENMRRQAELTHAHVKETLQRRITELETQLSQVSPDNTKYEILDSYRSGPNLVLKVQYPSCSKCSYEGIKILVFMNVTESEVLRWKKIDPHFRENTSPRLSNEAPSPAARFPASEGGWQEAIRYINNLTDKLTPCVKLS